MTHWFPSFAIKQLTTVMDSCSTLSPKALNNASLSRTLHVSLHGWSLTWSGVTWLEMLGLLGSRPIPGICWVDTGVERWSYGLGRDGVAVCCETAMFCCLVGFQAGSAWFWTVGVGVLLILCWPGDILCTGEWELAVLGWWDAGESVRLLTGRGLALLFNPAKTYCTFTPDCTLRSWPSGKANLWGKEVWCKHLQRCSQLTVKGNFGLALVCICWPPWSFH